MLQKPSACQGCPMFTLGTGFVPDEHISKLPNVKFAILAEAAGATEAEAGVPLWGATGQTLHTEVLTPKEVYRDDVLFGNVLRCQPPKNIFPVGSIGHAAIKHCRRYDTALDAYDPNVVILAYHPTFSLIRAPGVRFSPHTAVEKALKFHARGYRPLIAMGEQAMKLLFPSLDEGTISTWDRSHFIGRWTKSAFVIDADDQVIEQEQKELSLADLLED